MARSTDLCTLEDLKTWLGQTTTDSDPLLGLLISGASSDIYAYLNRDVLLQQSVTETYERIGNNGKMMLQNYPVSSVASVILNGQAIAAAAIPGLNSVPSSGYYLDNWNGIPPGQNQSLNFPSAYYGGYRGFITVTYTAGYGISNEAQTIPASANGSGAFLVNVNAPWGPWAADGGVTYASGAALTRVQTAPSAGQYKLDATAGAYIFSAADANAAVLITYAFIPTALNQACMEIAAERFKYKTRIGESSVTTAGVRTVSYRNEAMSLYVKSLLSSYVRTTTYG